MQQNFNFNKYLNQNSNQRTNPYIKDIKDEFLNKLSNEDTYTNYIDRPSTVGNFNNLYNNENTRNQNDKENEYEKLLNNLNLMSGLTNNFFYILQGILGISCDTLFTDYSTTNVKENDIRLQMILETIMDKLKM